MRGAPPGEQASMSRPSEPYHLFGSYTRTPDAGLARELERFLECFHTT